MIKDLMKDSPDRLRKQYQDNLLWIEQAGENKLVVGSQARILYSGAEVFLKREKIIFLFEHWSILFLVFAVKAFSHNSIFLFYLNK